MMMHPERARQLGIRDRSSEMRRSPVGSGRDYRRDGRGDGTGNFGGSYFEQRLQARQAIPLDPRRIWAPSPPPSPVLANSPQSSRKRRSRNSKSKRRRDSEDDSDESGDKRIIRERKRKSKNHRKSRISKPKHAEMSKSSESDFESDEEKSIIQTTTSVQQIAPSDDKVKIVRPSEVHNANASISSDEEFGPALPPTQSSVQFREKSYGGALLPGEGSAIASFVQAGQRIPRRGEVGLSSEQIDKFEQLGYVMSGSRHTRMNAIRMRKENQVYSAEEKQALAMINHEERQRKEQALLAGFRSILSRKEEQILLSNAAQQSTHTDDDAEANNPLPTEE